MVAEELRTYFENLFTQKEAAGLPLVFDAGVLERYREAGARFIRTDHAGRFQLTEGARRISLEFGIVEEARVIVVLLGDLWSLPEGERAHWAGYLRLPPLSPRYLRLRSATGCVDDGEVRVWDGVLTARQNAPAAEGA